VTQNVDGLHQAAGNTKVIELHGNIFKLKPFQDEEALFGFNNQPSICHACNGYTNTKELDEYVTAADVAALQLEEGNVPKCPACGNLMRPDVTWFYEQLDVNVLGDAVAAVENCDALICIGSSLQVEPAASLPFVALERGAVVIEVNPQPKLKEIAHATIPGAAGEVLPQLVNEIWGIR
jgi:NAD-dependent deacetylase